MHDAEWEAVRLSLWVAAWAVGGSLAPAVAAGYLLARWNGRAKWLVETAVNLPLVLPPVVTGYILLVLLGRRGAIGGILYWAFGTRVAFTWVAAAVAAAVVGFPLMVRSIRLAFQGVDPRLEAAARSLGAGRAETFLRVSMPLAARGIAAGVVLGFARGLGEFGATIVVAGNVPGVTQTVPLAIYSWLNRPDGSAVAWRLACVSIGLAAAALVASEWLERRERRRVTA